MPDITLKDVDSFHAWAHMLIHNEESYLIPEANAHLDIYGQDDSAYLVLDVYTNQTEFTQYVFIASNEDDSEKVAILIFDFLKTVDFSLKKLIEWLEESNFENPENEGRVKINGIDICRSRPRKKEKRMTSGRM